MLLPGLRSSHLEAKQSSNGDTLYWRTRGDLDEALLARTRRVRRLTAQRFANLLWRPPPVLEIVEPLYARFWWPSLAMAFFIKTAGVLRGQRVEIVAYAIEVLPTAEIYRVERLGWAQLARLNRLMVRSVRASTQILDKIAFGSTAAEQRYLSDDLALKAKSTTILRLECPCPCLNGHPPVKDSNRVQYVGEFTSRKGVDVLIGAWPIVKATHPAATLSLIGFGELLPEVQSLSRRDDVTVVESPSRSEIHDAYRISAVVVLASKRVSSWQEQIGLSVVEGLAHGCTVVASTETALREWLGQHEHVVFHAGDNPSQNLALSINRALEAQLSAEQVLASLPNISGRLAAERWLYS